MKINFFKKNPLDYQGAIIRESEFEIIQPLYFYLKEYQFFKTQKQRLVPYQIKFEWDMGLKKRKDNLVIRVVYGHVCNHGIDHPGIDRRQWNQFAIKMDIWNKNFFFRNSAGYVLSPFGPKRKNNNYNWIFLHSFVFKKVLGYISIFFNIELHGFFEISSLKYAGIFRTFIENKGFLSGAGFERHYGLNGENNEIVSLKELFTGITEKIPDFRISYGYLFKNPKFSYFSNFLVKYMLFKDMKLLTHLKTTSPPKTQQPRFYDYKVGIEVNFKKFNLLLYQRERRDGNLFDGVTEEINSVRISSEKLFENTFLRIFLDYTLFKKNYPFFISAGVKFRRVLYKGKNLPFVGEFETEFTYLYGKNKRGFIFEYGPSFLIRKCKEIGFCFREKISSEESLEHYGIMEHKFFISLRLKNEEKY